MTKELPGFDALGALTEFFEILGNGAQHVVLMHPENGPVQGDVFDHPAEAAAFCIHGNVQGLNAYYTPHSLDDTYTHLLKPPKSTIRKATCLHVDIDPPAGDYASGRASCLAKVEDLKDAGANLIVDSGNGIQALFLLAESTGSLGAVEEVNRELITRFGGDKGTWNVDRLLRCPYTTNFSSLRKIAQGYPEATQARILHDDGSAWAGLDDVRESLGEIEPAAIGATPDKVTPIAGVVDERTPIADIAEIAKEVVFSRFKSILGKDDCLRRRMSGDLTGCGDSSRSALDKSIGVRMRSAGFSLEEFYYLMQRVEPMGSAFGEKSLDYRYFRRCFGNAVGEEVEIDGFTEFKALPHAKRQSIRLIKAANVVLEPVPYLVDEVVEEGALTLLFGDYKIGKTFCVMDMALSVAAGIPYHGRAVNQRPVVYVAGEGQRSLQRRIKAWCVARGVDADTLPFYFTNRATAMLDPGRIAELVNQIEHDCPDVCLVLIDTVARNFGGNENDSTDVNKLFDVVDDVRGIFPDLTVLLVAHPGKQNKELPRGSAAFACNADNIVRIYIDESTVETERPILVMKSIACKESAGFGELHFELENVEAQEGIYSLVPALWTHGVGEEGRAVREGVDTKLEELMVEDVPDVEEIPTDPTPTEPLPSKCELKESRQLEAIEKALEEEPDASIRRLSELTGIGKSTVGIRLIKLGYLEGK